MKLKVGADRLSPDLSCELKVRMESLGGVKAGQHKQAGSRMEGQQANASMNNRMRPAKLPTLHPSDELNCSQCKEKDRFIKALQDEIYRLQVLLLHHFPGVGQ